MPSAADNRRKTVTGGRVVGRTEADPGTALHNYTPDNFYPASTDKDGNFSNIKMPDGKTIAVPRWVGAQISELIEDDLIPYRSRWDLVRDAIIHRVHYLQAKRDHKDIQAWENFVEMAEIERKVSEAERQAGYVQRIREVLSGAVHEGDAQLLHDTFAAAQKMLPALREPYAGRLQQTLAEYQQVTVAQVTRQSG